MATLCPGGVFPVLPVAQLGHERTVEGGATSLVVMCSALKVGLGALRLQDLSPAGPGADDALWLATLPCLLAHQRGGGGDFVRVGLPPGGAPV